MKILHVISGLDPQNGGTTTALVGMAASQAHVGLDVTVLSTWKIEDGKPVADGLRAKGVQVIHIGPATGKLSRHPELKKMMMGAVNNADVVHIHGLFEQAQHDAARAAMELRKPYVITPHGMLSPWNMQQNKWGKKLYMLWRLQKNLHHAAAIHYTTDAERDLAIPLKLPGKAVVMPLGLDVEEFKSLPERGTFRRQFPQLADQPFVLFLGRLDYKKGLDILIPAFADANLPNVKLVLAGPDRDGYGPTVRRLVELHHLQDRVIFTGMLHGKDRLAAYVDASLFALTSYQENFGITVIEAMACGCPVLISDQVNIFSQVNIAKAGRVVAANREQTKLALAEMINDSQSESMGKNGRDFAMDKYDWIQIAAAWKLEYTLHG